MSGAILWTHFVGGLTNQRMNMKDGIYLAALLKRPIVLPSWILSREKFIPNWTVVPWEKFSINQVYDVEYLILCLEKLNIKALPPCLPNTCIPGFVPPRLGLPAIQAGQHISLPFVVGNFTPNFLSLPSRESLFRHGIDSCITWSSEIQTYGQRVLEHIRSLCGRTNMSNVFGLHLRLEDDFPTYIASSRIQNKNRRTVVLQEIENEIIDGALNCFNSHLKYVNFSQSWIYIATGVTKNSSKLTKVLEHFPLFITKETFSESFVGLGMDLIGAIDSFILEQLPFFVGIVESSFSHQVAENRRRKYLPSAFYTVETPDKCPIFDISN